MTETTVIQSAEPSEETAIVAGAALAESANAEATAEEAEATAEVALEVGTTGAEIAVVAAEEAAEAKDTGQLVLSRMEDLGRAVVILGDTQAVHTQALTELLRERQAGRNGEIPAIEPVVVDAAPTPGPESDSVPQNTHPLERKLFTRKRSK